MPACLHLLNSYLPLTETFIWQYLSQAGDFRPLILADKRENEGAFPLPRAGFLTSSPSRSRLAALGARLLGRYAQADYRSCLAETLALKPSLLHIHNGYRACVSLDFTDRLRLPYAVNFYGSDVSRKEFLRRARPGYARLVRRGKAFLVEGPVMGAKLAALGFPEDRIRLQRIAINVSDYAFRERTWDGNRPIRFLFVGRLVEKKGLEWGLRALARRKSDFPWELDIIGDGALRPALEAQIARLGIGDRVRILGYLPLPVMRGKLQDHDILFQPSCTSSDGDGEGGAPTVLLEAQACGMPILSSRHDDIPYVTVPDGSGLPVGSALLAPERDVEVLSALILRLAESAGSWREMGRTGRRHVEDRHDVRKEVIGLESLYREIQDQSWSG
jgi:colanic acid/amylovoran biosynthesis glycosyltransferase